MHRQRISKTKVNIKKRQNFFVSDGQRGRPVGALHCDGCWGYSHGSYCQHPFPLQKKEKKEKEISFFFFSWNIWSERAASTNVKNVQILRLDDIKNHEADMLGFKTLRLNLYRLLKTHQMSIMSLEKKNLSRGDKYFYLSYSSWVD